MKLKPRLALVPVALAVSAIVALGGPAQAEEVTTADSPEAALAEKFAPVVSLVEQTEACGPGEPYQPSDVAVMFDNSSVALRGPWTQRDLVKPGPSVEDVAVGLPGYSLDLPGNPLDPQCSYEQWANAQWGKKSEATVYARVASQKGVEGRLALQYFFFYPFNDYNNKHETDWERIQLEFAADNPTEALDQTPVRAVYSQHYGSEYAVWGDEPDAKLEIEDGTHPVVYVSAGSHANQFSSGVFMGNNAEIGFGCDSTAGEQRRVDPVVATIPSDPEVAKVEFPWTTYLGHWGEVGPRRFYEGPTGPNRKQAWNKPFTWADKARSSSFEVPGAGAVGTRATDAYCSVVGTGSDAFRRFVASPLTGILAIAAALGACLWLLRRTTWETDELPLRLNRSAGQVAYAAWQMFVTHLGLFLTISAPMVGLSLLSVAIQTVSFLGRASQWWQAASSALWLTSLLLAAAATVRAVRLVDRGEPVSARIAYATSWRRAIVAIPAFVVAGVLLVLMFSSLLLVPVALLLVAAWTLVVPLVVDEELSGFRSLWTSIGLGRRNARTIVPVTVSGIVLLIAIGALLAAGVFVVYPAPFVILNSIPPLVFAILWPLIAIASSYQLATARAREQDRELSGAA